MNWNKAIYHTLSILGYTKIRVRYLIQKGDIPVLVFHRITPDYDLFTQPIHPDGFYKLMKELSLHFQFASLASLDNTPPDGSLCVTFDDATEDFYHFAWPILKELDIPVTLFVPVESVLSGKPIWNYEVFSWLAERERGERITILGKHYKVPHNNTKLFSLGQVLINGLEGLSIEDRRTVVQNLEYEKCLAPPMSWSQLREIVDQGVKIGSHSFTHSNLCNLSTQEILFELAESKYQIETELGITPECIAYPRGNYNEMVSKIATRFHDKAFSTTGLPYNRTDPDGSAVPRIGIYNSSVEENYLRITGLHHKVRSLIG